MSVITTRLAQLKEQAQTVEVALQAMTAQAGLREALSSGVAPYPTSSAGFYAADGSYTGYLRFDIDDIDSGRPMAP